MYIEKNQPQMSSRSKNIIKNSQASTPANVLRREAAIGTSAMSPGVLGAVNSGPVLRMAMKPFSPLYQESNLMLPKDRKTMNAYNRHYYETDYWVGNAIELHTTFPLGGFQIISRHKEIEKVFNKMAKKIDLYNILLAVGLEYWIYGESFPFLEWDETEGMWYRATVFNPDLIEVRRTPFSNKSIISLIPDSELKRIATSTHPSDQVLRSQISPKILDYVLKGESIPLNFRNVAHVVRKTVHHDVRGTSIIQRVWKELMLRDAMREVLFVMAQNHITPLKIFRIGGKEKDYFPTDDELEYWQGIVEEAQNDPNYSIVTHEAFDVEYKGFTGQVLDVTQYLKLIEDHVLQGLGVTKAIISAEGVAYANASVAYEILQKRYSYVRNVMSQWLINKVFMPVSIAHGFKDKRGGYIVPMIKWDNISFTKDGDWRRMIVDLNKSKKVSDRTLITEVGLDYDEEQELVIKEQVAAKLKKENIKAMQDQAESGGLGDLGGMGGGMDLGGGMGGMGGGMSDLGDLGEGFAGEGGEVPSGEMGGGEELGAP